MGRASTYSSKLLNTILGVIALVWVVLESNSFPSIVDLLHGCVAADAEDSVVVNKHCRHLCGSKSGGKGEISEDMVK